MLMPVTEPEVELPALSETLALVAPSLSPSPVMLLLAGQAPARPESESLQVQAMATSPLYQPSSLGFVVAAPVTTGAVLSMLMSPTVALASLSATSTALPITDCLAPSVVTVWFGPQLLMPEAKPGLSLVTPCFGSSQAKLTVTSVLFHPDAGWEGVRLPVMVGTAVSILTVSEPLPPFPRRSVAPEFLVAPLVGVVTLSVQGFGLCPLPAPSHLRTKPTPASAPSQVMSTALLFQPAPLAAGESDAETLGPALSRT